MATNRGELISPSDYTNLKALVEKEISRRSNSKSVGSMSGYNNSNWKYGTTPSRSVKITNEHIKKITQPLDAV